MKHNVLHNRTQFRNVEFIVFSCKLVSHIKLYKSSIRNMNSRSQRPNGLRRRSVGASWLLLLTWVGAGIFTWEIDRRFLAPLREQWSSCSTGNIEVFPFDSVSNIFRAAKSVPDFHKRRFPPKLAQRRIYNAWLERISIHIPPLILLPFVFVGWTVALPFVLLIQLCPVCVNQRVVTIGTGDVVTKSR